MGQVSEDPVLRLNMRRAREAAMPGHYTSTCLVCATCPLRTIYLSVSLRSADFQDLFSCCFSLSFSLHMVADIVLLLGVNLSSCLPLTVHHILSGYLSFFHWRCVFTTRVGPSLLLTTCVLLLLAHSR